MLKENNQMTHELLTPELIKLDNSSPEQFKNYYLDNKLKFDQLLLETGVIKFQGVLINDVEDFQSIVDGISSKFLEYVDGNSPRKKLSGNVYTSTEYDNTQKITMHNELSYSAKWPSKLFLSCIIPSETGGETLLADSREIARKMDKNILNQVEEKGIVYIRNLHNGEGMGPSWQDTFETNDPKQLEEYCNQYSIQFEWKTDGGIRLLQPSQGVRNHNTTGEKLWFNQISQFHASHLGPELYSIMQDMYDSPEDFPMHVRFGNGDTISETMVEEIIHTIDNLTIAPKWDKHEFLVLDNELICHGRNPYTGERRVVLSMSE